MANERIREQEELYIYDTILNGVHHRYYKDTGVDNRVTTFKYGDNYSLVVSGGSGTGSLHYSVSPVTGDASISSSGALTFKTYGTVWVHIYKDGSRFSRDPDTGSSVNGYYEQSKTLILEVTLDRRTVTIKVRDSYGGDTVVRDIGSGIPSINSLGLQSQVSVLNTGDTLSVSPTLYFVYLSDDFYKFDVMSRAYSETSYMNGVRFSKLDDGYWYVEGTASGGAATYNLITSAEEVPSYMVKGRWYQLVIRGSIPIKFTWYFQGGVTRSSEYRGNNYGALYQQIQVPESCTGVIIQMQAYVGTVYHHKVLYNMLDIEERKMDDSKVSEYPVAAFGAKVPDTNHYHPTIKYKSAKLKYDNISYYRIYPNYDYSMGDLYTSVYRAKPYTEFTFSVVARAGTQYTDGWDSKYIASTGTGPYDSLWGEQEVTQGSNQLYIYDKNNVRVPFQQTSAETESSGLLRRSVYKVKMPISSVIIYCNFEYISSASTGSYYGPWPYSDVNPSGGRIRYSNSEYYNALLFCYYARKVYMHEYETPLMQGAGSGTFYGTIDGATVHPILRKDMITVIQRISHCVDYNWWGMSDQFRSDPDNTFMSMAEAANIPKARMYNFAGHYNKEDPPVKDTDLATKFPEKIRKNASAGGLANEDYMASYANMPGISWGTWVGVMSGGAPLMFQPNCYATYEEAATVLWRYARFRQIDVRGHGYYDYVDDSGAASWAQNGPIKWAVSNGIMPSRSVEYYEDGWHGGDYIEPRSNVDRADFALMVMKFCQLYAW